MKKSNLKTRLADFNTSLKQLRADEKNNLQIEQNHFGDFLMIKEPKEWCNTHNYRVWLSHPNNIADGACKWIIEYAGENNGYSWKEIAKG